MNVRVRTEREIQVTRWRPSTELEFLRKHLRQKLFRWHEKERGSKTAIFRWEGDIFDEQQKTELEDV